MATLQDAHCKRCGRLIFAATPHPDATCLRCKQTQPSETNNGTGQRLRGVVEAAAGSAHFLLRCGDGTVYSCGAGAFGRLGHGDEQGLCAPKLLRNWQWQSSNPLQPTAQPGGGCALLSNVRALRIGAGGLHSAIVGVLPTSNAGSLATTSNSTAWQTKVGSGPDCSPSTACSRPTQHKDAQSSVPAGDAVRKAGSEASFNNMDRAECGSGDDEHLWLCGSGQHGVLGMGAGEIAASKVSTVGTQAHMTSKLTTWATAAYDTSANANTMRASSSFSDAHVPTLSALRLSRIHVRAISCGERHTLALFTDAVQTLEASGGAWGVLSWGCGRDGRLGHGGERDEATPRPIRCAALRPSGGRRAIRVSAGGQHSLIMTGDGDVLAFGHAGSGRLGIGLGVQGELACGVHATAGSEGVAGCDRPTLLDLRHARLCALSLSLPAPLGAQQEAMSRKAAAAKTITGTAMAGSKSSPPGAKVNRVVQPSTKAKFCDGFRMHPMAAGWSTSAGVSVAQGGGCAGDGSPAAVWLTAEQAGLELRATDIAAGGMHSLLVARVVGMGNDDDSDDDAAFAVHMQNQDPEIAASAPTSPRGSASPLTMVGTTTAMAALIASRRILACVTHRACFAFGSGARGALGLGNREDALVPTLVPLFRGANGMDAVLSCSVHDVAVGAHAARPPPRLPPRLRLRPEEQRLWHAAATLDPVSGDVARRRRQRLRARCISAGDAHSVIAADGGRVFVCGRGADGALGLGDMIERLLPAEITHLSCSKPRARVRSVAAGGTFSLFVTERGIALACGALAGAPGNGPVWLLPRALRLPVTESSSGIEVHHTHAKK